MRIEWTSGYENKIKMAITSAMKNTAKSESISAEVHRIKQFDGQTKHHPHRLGSVS